LRKAVRAEMTTNAKNTALNERETDSFLLEYAPAANNETTTILMDYKRPWVRICGNEKNLPERAYAARSIVTRTIQKSKIDTMNGWPYLIIAAIILRVSIATSIIDSNSSDPW